MQFKAQCPQCSRKYQVAIALELEGEFTCPCCKAVFEVEMLIEYHYLKEVEDV